MKALSNMKENINNLLHQFKQIGATAEGGITRVVYDQNWLAAQQQFIQIAKAYGLHCFADKMGNVYASTTEFSALNTVILTGSHIDTVVNGGWLDGQYGVLSSLISVGELYQRYGSPNIPLCVVSFSEEEGSRFDATFTGSRYLTRHLDPNIFNLVDQTGELFDHARQSAIIQLQRTVPIVAQAITVKNYIELHIEQGNILTQNMESLGIVTAIVGQKRLLITTKGVSNHAGTTPMARRSDAMPRAVKIMDKLYTTLENVADLRYTIGKITVLPNETNVIPSKVEFSLDRRHASQKQLEEALKQVIRITKDGQGTYQVTTDVLATDLDSQLVSSLQCVVSDARKSGYLMISGAGHDAQVLSLSGIPSVMLFVPSQKGISHTPAENTSSQHLLLGQQMLQAYLKKMAY